MKSSECLKRFRKILRRHMPELKKRYQIRTLGVFGSYVRQAHQASSDLDLLVEFGEVPACLSFWS